MLTLAVTAVAKLTIYLSATPTSTSTSIYIYAAVTQGQADGRRTGITRIAGTVITVFTILVVASLAALGIEVETLTWRRCQASEPATGRHGSRPQDEDGDVKSLCVFSALLQLLSSLPSPTVPIAWPASRRRPDLSISTATPDTPCAIQVNNNNNNACSSSSNNNTTR